MNSPVVSLSSGYSLKSGSRPGDGLTEPDGTYDGEYYEDYEYTSTVLDSCNGRYAKTPDYPYGTYYYVITDNYPFIPRCFKGTELDHTYRIGPDASCPASTASTNCAAAVSGCMDPVASNYNANANIDNGSCTYNLPVELLHLTVKKEGQFALLEWQTAIELNNSHFEIEWSTDGIRFEHIDDVEGEGVSGQMQNYEYLHMEISDGNNYYRLRQVDFDGQYAYSNIILLKTEATNTPLKVYPNPTTGLVTIETKGEATIFITNIYGQQVRQVNISGKQDLNLSYLPEGIYLVHNGTNTQRLVIGR